MIAIQPLTYADVESRVREVEPRIREQMATALTEPCARRAPDVR